MREREPGETLRIVADYFPGFGITRVGDLTGMDWLGVPVAAAYRPSATTLAVSQGKALDRPGAMVGAAMESIELCHAERLSIEESELVPVDGIYLDEILALGVGSGFCIKVGGVIPSLPARGLVTGRRRWVPVDLVRLSFAMAEKVDGPFPEVFHSTSNGLASGNSYSEAVLHGLLEVVERDSLTRATYDDFVVVDPSAGFGYVDDLLISLLKEPSIHLEVEAVMNRWSVPCFRARLWTEDFPIVAVGAGAHVIGAIALERAILEAAQSRVTQIVGVRDDIDPADFDMVRARLPRPTGAPTVGMENVVGNFRLFGERTVGEFVRALADHVLRVGGHEPLAVELSAAGLPFSVVKILVPGAVFDDTLSFSSRMPRPAAAM